MKNPGGWFGGRVFQGAEENAPRFPGACGWVWETRCSSVKLPPAVQERFPQPSIGPGSPGRSIACRPSVDATPPKYSCRLVSGAATSRPQRWGCQISRTGPRITGVAGTATSGISSILDLRGRLKAESGSRFRGSESSMEVTPKSGFTGLLLESIVLLCSRRLLSDSPTTSDARAPPPPCCPPPQSSRQQPPRPQPPRGPAPPCCWS